MPIIPLIFTFLIISLLSIHPKSIPTLMLNPGIASEAIIHEETYEWAYTLKHELQKRFLSDLRIVISHGLQEPADQMQIASFANRLPTDLYLSLHLCKNAQPKLHIYTRADHPVTDYWYIKTNALVLVPTAKAHTIHAKLSRSLAQQLEAFLKNQSTFTPHLQKTCGLPFMPLYGIQAPAFALELSVSKIKEWRLFLIPLVDGLVEILQPLVKAEKTS